VSTRYRRSDDEEWERGKEDGPQRYTFTRAQLIDALTCLEVRFLTEGPMAGKVVADQFADTLIEALERRETAAERTERRRVFRVGLRNAGGSDA
jgi:hypothetical protein